MLTERIFPGWASTVRLEASLGDPYSPSSSLSFAKAVAEDEREAYPEAAIRTLHEWGYHRHFVPVAEGGEFTSLESLMALVRSVARRDLTVAIALAQTFLGSVPVWMGGDAQQRADIARVLLDGGQMALALTEEAHGADVLSSETIAEIAGDGYRLYGTKWLINNGTRGSAFSVFVRTDSRPGPRSFSMFVVKRPATPAQGITSLEKLRTHGIRGADISGIRFDGAQVSKEVCLGPVGSGFDLLLKVLYVTRTGCGAFSLGAADTALRVTLDFVRSRRLYGSTAWHLPHVRSSLVDAFLDLLIAEAVSVAATRVLHIVPGQAPVTSAIAKYEVPVRVERLVRELGTIIGARHHLRQDLAHGVFQKLARDVTVVALFDGSAAVNLDALGTQIPRILRQTPPPVPLSGLFDLDQDVPPFDPSRYSVFTNHDDVIGALRNGSALVRLDALAPHVAAAAEAKQQILPLVEELEAMGPWIEDFRRREKLGAARSLPMLDVARRYCALWAASALVHLWLHNRDRGGPFLREGLWLGAALGRLHAIPAPRSRPRHEDYLAEHLLRLHDEERGFSFVPIPYSGRSRS